MAKHYLHSLQTLIEDPDVLAAVISTADSRVTDGIKVQPSQAEHIIKQGKSPAAEAIAPVVTDEKLLAKMSRDNRKGVRAAFLRNPLITQAHLEEVLRRSLKHDADAEVALPAAKKMEDDLLLSVLKDHVQTTGERFLDTTVYLGGVKDPSTPSTYRTQGGSLSYELCRRLPIGGVEYLRKLHELDFQAYVTQVTRPGNYYNPAPEQPWYEAGMLTWMVPEMNEDHVPLLLAKLLEADQYVSLEDVQVAAEVIERVGSDMFPHAEPTRRLTAKLDDDTLRLLYNLGTYWRKVIRRAVRMPEDLQLKYVSESTDAELLQFTPPQPDQYHMSWNPKVPEDAKISGPDGCDNWQSPEAVNIIAERWVGQLKKAVRDGQQMRGTPQSVFTHLMQFVQSVRPESRSKLSPEVLMLAGWGNASRYGNLPYDLTGTIGSEGFVAWVQGDLDDKPTQERIVELFELAQLVGGGQGHQSQYLIWVLRAVCNARRVSYLLGKPLEVAGNDALRVTEAVYMVFHHYLGNDPEAWAVAVDLATDWDDSLEDLALTAAAATGVETPDEVVDLADLEATEEDKSDEAEAAEDAPEEPENTEEPAEGESTEEASEPAEEPQAPVEEPAEAESAEDPVEDGTEAEDDSPEEEEEDVKSLDVTTPVMYTLF